MSDTPAGSSPDTRHMPRWVPRAVVLFWLGYLGMLVVRYSFNRLSQLLILLLVSLFLAFAIEPGVNALSRRGWGRRRATSSIILAIILGVLAFIGIVGTVVGTQLADLATNSEQYVNDTVKFINDAFNTNIDPQAVNDRITDPNGPVQKFIDSQQDRVFSVTLQALGVLLQILSIVLFTYYLVADGPRLRRSICSRLEPDRQRRVLDTWDLAITKTGGYLYSRALLASLSAFFHWIAFQAIGIPAPVAMALWVGLVSQFLPVIGTYLAGVLPILLAFLDSPLKALISVGFIVVYQQVENYLFAPRVTARTMEIHPAFAFGGAIAGGALLGPIGAILALPAAAMAQALASSWGQRYNVIDDTLTNIREIDKPQRKRTRKRKHQ
ncbi:MAG: AI-2E family transporter [Actinobacteria bacterium]|nr:AI-2E family transporter [Actinomycetota bacterium]